jgi:hypothetical protein
LCKGEIKQSHSIQRNGRLSLIEGDVNGNKMIYTFTETEVDEKTLIKSLKPVGKGSASTFFGFCDYHDTHLFSPIESKPFNDSSEHLFLHSYRSFAHSYHRMKEILKSYLIRFSSTGNNTQTELLEDMNDIKLIVNNAERFKSQLDNLITNKLYDGLEYFSVILSECYPIACSSQITPLFSYKNKPMSYTFDGQNCNSSLMLTVLPDSDKTIVILACFPDDVNSILLLEELNCLDDFLLNKAISSLLINCAENTFFAPALWNTLGFLGQKRLCKELDTASKQTNSRFIHRETNFFAPKFSKKRLGI